MRLFLPLLLCLALLAQNPVPEPPKAAAAKPAQPPDFKAFSEANGTKDPGRKAAALEKFLQDFPASNMASSARREIIVALVKTQPKDAVKRTSELAKGRPVTEAAGGYRFLAAELNSAKQLPKDAEKAARKALKLFQYPAFAAENRAEAEKAKRPVPTEAQLKSRYGIERARMNETLGQILETRGQTAKAAKVYQEALRANPSLTTAAQSLGAAADKAGLPDEALGYYAQAMLARPSPESRKRFYDAWQKAKGTPQGAEIFLDQRYKALFPNPVHASIFQKPAARSNRVVLAEVYTGAGCPPCVGADLAFDAVLERYPRSDVAMVMYHQHIPRPDPLTNTDTLVRWKWQQGRGVPTYAVDGEDLKRGGGSRDMAVDLEVYIRESIERQLLKPAGAVLDLKTSNDGRNVKATALVRDVAKTSPDLVLHIALVEKEVRYSGENGVRFHPMVVRGMHTVALADARQMNAAHAFSLDAAAAAIRKHLDDFEKHDERHNKDGKFRFMERTEAIDAAHLGVVAYVQDSKTREVLQAAWADAPKE